MRASFHFPLHRYLAAFTCQAVSKMNMTLKDIIPPPDLLTLLLVHPLRVQVSYSKPIICKEFKALKASKFSDIDFNLTSPNGWLYANRTTRRRLVFVQK